MSTQVDLSSISIKPEQSVYVQIADHIRRQVALSKMRPGERLPAIRSLAAKLRLDPGTVARAYRELEREGIVVGRHGGGSHIAADIPDRYLAEQQQKRLSLVVDRSILEALSLGFSVDEIAGAFTARLADWRERKSEAKGRRLRAGAAARKEVRFVGSHDLAVELLASQVRGLHPELRFSTTFVGSLAGLVAVECGQADLAGTHLLDEETGSYNVSFVRKLMPNENVVVMNLAIRRQGLIVAPHNPKRVRGIEDLAREDIVFVNRQKGSGTRILLDSSLRKAGIASSGVRGYDDELTTHTAVASVIAEGHADVALGVESAATVAGLDFIPMVSERYDLVALQQVFDLPSVAKISEVIRSDSYKQTMRNITGYDVSETGTTAIIGPQ